MHVNELYRRLAERYPLRQEIIRLANRNIAIAVVVDPDQFLDELSKEEHDGALRLPYWAYLWPSSIALARHLDQMDSLKSQRVLEIGCGFGLGGIVGSQGGGKVLFTDYEKDALLFAQYNAFQNRCLEGTSFAQMDWNDPCLKGRFARILAADVVYEEKNWKPILALIQKHLALDGTAIIAEPNRANADGFFDLLARYGYSTEEFGYTALLEEDPSTITVYCVRREE